MSSLDSSLLEQEQREQEQDTMQQMGSSPEQPNRNGQRNVQPVMIPPFNRGRWPSSETAPNVSGTQRYTRSYNHQNLRSMQPKQLKKTSDVIALKGFIQKFKSLWRRAPESEINDYIDARLWQRKMGSHPKIFKEGNNEAILHYFEGEIAREERNRRNEPWGYATQKIVFRPKEDKSLYGQIMDFLADTREVMAYANSKKMKREMIRMAVFQLPQPLRYLRKRVEYKLITTMDAVEEEVSRHEDSLAKPVSRKYKKKLKEHAHEARKKLKKIRYASSDDDSEGERDTSASSSDSETASDSSNSDSDDDANHTKRGKKKKKVNKKKDKRDKTDNELTKAITKLAKKVQALEVRTNGPKKSSKDDMEVNEITQSGDEQDPSEGPPIQTERQIEVNEVTVFALEETEAQRLGVCYGCHQEGHNRRNCPDATNRVGKPKRIFGLCFNCGQKGHYWRDCTFKLKYHLERYLKERRDRYNKKLGQLNRLQGRESQKGRENKNPPFQESDNRDNRERGDQRVMKAEPPISENNAVNTISINATEIERPFKVTSVSTVRSAIIEAKKGNQWIKVTGKVDSGACTTVGSIEKHGHLCLHVWKPIGTNTSITVANGARVEVVAKGLIHLRVDERELPPAEILLVQARNWQNLLIGEDLLQDQNLSVQGKSRRA